MSKKKDDKNKEEENEEFNEEWNGGSDDSDDSFGLPDVEFKPVDNDDDDEAEEEQVENSTEETEEKTEEIKDTDEEETETVAEEEAEETESDPEPESETEEELHYEDDESYTTENLDEPEYEETYQEDKVEEEKSSVKGPVTIIIVTVIIIALAVVGYFFYLKPIQEKNSLYDAAIAKADKSFKSQQWDAAITEYREADKIKPEEDYPDNQIAKATKGKADAAARAAEAEKKRLADEEAARLAAEAAKPKIGTVEFLTARTGKYYVVVASNIDDDLAQDFAKKLAKNGTSFKILTPYGDNKYYRVTVDQRDTYGDAQDRANELKSQFNGAWVVKY